MLQSISRGPAPFYREVFHSPASFFIDAILFHDYRLLYELPRSPEPLFLRLDTAELSHRPMPPATPGLHGLRFCARNRVQQSLQERHLGGRPWVRPWELANVESVGSSGGTAPVVVLGVGR